MQDVTQRSPRIDVAAFDMEGRPVLLAEIKARAGAVPTALERLNSLASTLDPAGLAIPFWMVVDLDRLLIFTNQAGIGLALGFEASTADILAAYDPEYRQKRIFEDYLVILIEAWLHDLADQWKHDSPPGTRELAQLGLVERLRGGETHREVSLVGRDFVHRNQFFDKSRFGTRSLD